MKLTQLTTMLTVILMATLASAQTDTTFTYQGELNENGTPATGDYNMEFSLWDAEVGGTLIGAFSSVAAVDNGKFAVQLDFGGDAFGNAARWLEIEVNGVPLSQRTPITRAPYAIQTRGIFVNQDKSFVGIGPTTSASNPATVLGISRDTDFDFGGMIVETTGGGGLPFYAYSAGGTAGAFHYVDGNTGNWHLVTNDTVQPLLTARPDESFGIGTSNTDFTKLSVFQNDPGYAVFATSEFDGGFLDSFAVYAEATGTGGIGVFGTAPVSGFAGYFLGNVFVQGTLSKSAGTFKIDHPLDPENKYLSHSFVESPDMMNVYNGNVVTGDDGYAKVELPVYFQALNRDFRYQLTVIGTFAQAIVAEEIQDNQFVIRTDKPGIKVSWQVTGIRQDAYAREYPIVVETDKSANDRGKYLAPKAFGKPAELAIGKPRHRERLLKQENNKTRLQSTAETKPTAMKVEATPFHKQ